MEGKMASLLLNCEGVGLATLVLVRNFFMIGRAPSNQIVIDHPTVSAQHAVLLRVGDSFWLKDLNSTNGTQINGVVVTDAKLKDGDTIRFGSALAVFAERCRKRPPSRGNKKSRTSISV
jgi:pSer/pThr/pTyr-binding forkhead associated (FHA) protein